MDYAAPIISLSSGHSALRTFVKIQLNVSSFSIDITSTVNIAMLISYNTSQCHIISISLHCLNQLKY